jgi:hypothetical protein
MRIHTRVVENVKEKDLDECRRITLKYILEEQDGVICDGFMLLTVEVRCGLLGIQQ